MRRFSLLELHEQTWAPAIIRDSVVECVYLLARRQRMVDSMMGPFREFLRRTEAGRVIDLCSGWGGPGLILAEQFARENGRAPHIMLTDRFPRLDHWEAVRRQFAPNLDYYSRPVDAARVPEDLAGGNPRMMHGAFHHFQPEMALAILRDAVENSPGIFISELFPRSLTRYLGFVLGCPWVVPCLPLLTSRQKLVKAMLSWPLPVISAVALWDGMVSALRVYTEADLRELTAGLGDRFEWVHGVCPFGLWGRATYFYGVRRG